MTRTRPAGDGNPTGGGPHEQSDPPWLSLEKYVAQAYSDSGASSCSNSPTNVVQTTPEVHSDASECYNRKDSNNCDEGYTGKCCQECSPGYYRKGKLCSKCEGSDSNGVPLLFELIVAIVVIVVFFGIFEISMLLCTDSQLDTVMLILLTFQFLAGIGDVASASLPQQLQIFFHYAAVVLLEFEIVRGECYAGGAGLFNFYTLFYGTLGLFVVLLVFNTILLPVFGFVRGAFFCGNKQLMIKYLQFYWMRYVRCCCLLLQLMYYIITLRGLQSFVCSTKDGQVTSSSDQTLYLVADPVIECFTVIHVLTMTVAAAVIVIVAVGFPLAVTILIIWLYTQKLETSLTSVSQ